MVCLRNRSAGPFASRVSLKLIDWRPWSPSQAVKMHVEGSWPRAWSPGCLMLTIETPLNWSIISKNISYNYWNKEWYPSYKHLAWAGPQGSWSLYQAVQGTRVWYALDGRSVHLRALRLHRWFRDPDRTPTYLWVTTGNLPVTRRSHNLHHRTEAGFNPGSATAPPSEAPGCLLKNR